MRIYNLNHVSIEAIKEAKKDVRDAKLKAYANFYARLDSIDGEKIIYKLPKLRERP